MLTLDLRFAYDDERTAKAVLAAVAPENGGYVGARIDGCAVFYHIEAETAGAMRNTADDLLACIRAAEEAAGLASEPEVL